MEIIILPSSGISKLAKDFKVSREWVGKALRGKANSPMGNMLRKAALERGGKLFREVTAPEGYVPECETTFDTAARTMTQVFSDRVRLVADLATGTVELFIDGKVQQTHQSVTLQQLADIQATAEQTANNQ